MHSIIGGKLCVKVGSRWYAIKRDQARADRIHAANDMPSTWDRQMAKPSLRIRETRSIRGPRSGLSRV